MSSTLHSALHRPSQGPLDNVRTILMPTDNVETGFGKQKSHLFRSYLRAVSFGARNGGIVAVILGLICAMGSGVALPLMNIIFGRLVGDFTQYFIPGTGFTKEKFLAAVEKNTLFILYLFAGKFILTYIYMICFRFVSLQASSTLRLKYIKALFSQPVSKLDELSPATVINAITGLSDTIQQSVADRIAVLFQTVTLLITTYSIAFYYSWPLTLVVSSAIIFIAICISITTPILIRLLYSINEADDKHMAIAAEVFSSVRTVFSLNAEEALAKKYERWVNESSRRGLKISKVGAVHLGLIFFGVYCSFSLAFWYGLRQFYYGKIDGINTVITVFFSVLIAVMVMGQIAAPLMIISKAVGASGAFFDVIDAQQPDKAGLKYPQVSSEEDIVFENVTFTYPSRPSVPVLRDFNARFQKGKITALVGPSGSGKSTVIALIEGWYQITADSDNGAGVYIGGQNINQVDLKWWRSQVGLVQQEPVLFNDTIYQNISRGLIGSRWENTSDAAKFDLVVAACKEAFADGFIRKLPAGYNTIVGEGGITLSGGQRQRLAIARSIVGKPNILILDEATSSMDIHSERIVQAALDRVAHNCTVIVIAHRLSTIQKADHIIVMKDGGKVEEGTHTELMQGGGFYQKLVEAQHLHAALDSTDQTEDAAMVLIDSEFEPQQTSNGEFTDMEHRTVIAQPHVKALSVLKGIIEIFRRSNAHWLLFMATLTAALGAGTGFSLQGWLFAKIMDAFRFLGQDLLEAADFWALMFFFLALGMGTCYAIIGYSSNSISMHVGAVARKEYFSNILRNSTAYFDRAENSSGSLVSRLSSDTRRLQEFCGIPSAFPLLAVFNVTGCLIIAFIYGWKLSAVGIFGVMPLLAAAAFLRIRHALTLDAINANVYADSSKFIAEAVKAFRTVSALTMEGFIIENYDRLLETQRADATRKAWYLTLIFAFSESMEFLAMAFSFWYGGSLLASREYNPLDFFVVFIAIIQAAQSAGIFFGFGPDITQMRASIQRILMEGSEADQGAKEYEKLRIGNQISLELCDISFRYESRTAPTINGLNMSINGGQFVAIVGPSGCGKSTLISLLDRFYQPTKGSILIDGRDLQLIDLQSYREVVGLVSQEPKLFEGSIEDNLLLGLRVASGAEDRMKQACRDAEIHDFIMSLPDGYATQLGMNAQVSLSGGQKQRLCIARALMRNPTVLLLDEATSSLDSESERLIQASFERLALKRKMIIIAVAHRLATIQKADCIYVFGEGGTGSNDGSRVVEQGTHQELLQRKGQYFHMCQAQALEM